MTTNLIQFFEKTASSNCEAIAIRDGELSVSFGELKNQETKYADWLDATYRTTRRPIAVFLPKCVHTIVADLAIIQSGNAYMNMDVKTPQERLANVLKQAQPLCIITNEKYRGIIAPIAGEVPIVLVEDLDKLEAREGVEGRLNAIIEQGVDTDPLCLINTSGSTGTPKCVVLNHRSFFDFMACAFETWDMEDGMVVGSLSPVIFDIYSFELCLLCAKRATLVLIPDSWAMFPVKILELLQKEKVSWIFWVPTIMVNMANMGLLEKMPLPDLKTVWFAGEVFPTKQFNVWKRKLPWARFVNLYGPIEITLDCTWFEVTREFRDDEPLPIGFPCRNTDILILNADDKPAASDEEGELCVRGTSLAMGYYNNPEKTAAAFTQNPLNTAYPEIIYRTGDIVSRNERGEIMFKGRKDTLIKHSGYRIELGEIEHVIINTLKLVPNGCVVYNRAEKVIVFFYEGERELSPAELRTAIGQVLPKYMIPSDFRHLPELPRGGTGKIDRALLNRQVNG